MQLKRFLAGGALLAVLVYVLAGLACQGRGPAVLRDLLAPDMSAMDVVVACGKVREAAPLVGLTLLALAAMLRPTAPTRPRPSPVPDFSWCEVDLPELLPSKHSRTDR